MKLYDTFSKSLETFEPETPGQVRMYNCGPTVYDFAHIGNFRSFLLADLLRRTFEFLGWRVHQVMNITDVGHLTVDHIADAEGEDKLAKAVRRWREEHEGETPGPRDVARFYEKAFFEDLDRLNILRAHEYPRATEHIDQMIAMVERLIENGNAYVADDAVYFDVTTFPSYGHLSGNRLEDLVAGARVAVREEKRNPADFALWKRDPDHLMQWDSPWGRGFPGWHIECSAMSIEYLGETFDIHTGGEDNIFPHHESEIAQSEAATGKRFARFWVHARHLLVDGKKMSKSDGNFYTIRDLIDRDYAPRAIRYALIRAHYRDQANFTLAGLEDSAQAIQRIDDALYRAARPTASEPHPELPACIKKARSAFREALEADLNVSGALAALFDFIKSVNQMKLGPGDGHAVIEALLSMDRVVGLYDGLLDPQELSNLAEGEALHEAVARGLGKEKGLVLTEEEIDALVGARQKAREEKNWDEADRIRDELKEKGIEVLDHPDGTSTWRPTA